MRAVNTTENGRMDPSVLSVRERQSPPRGCRSDPSGGKPYIEALDVAILSRLARPNEVERNSVLKGPGVEGLGDKLRAVVDANALRLALHRDQQREDGDDALARDRRIHLDDEALAREAVDD